jgi:retinol dehydrogenase-12
MGAHVIIACRDMKKGQEALTYIRKTAPKASVEIRPLNLGSLASVRSLASALLASNQDIHMLVLNAGVMNSPWRLTADGFEEHIGINHLGRFTP